MGPSTHGSCSAAWAVAWVAGMIAQVADTWAAARAVDTWAAARAAARAARVAQAARVADTWTAGQEGGKQAAWAD